MTGGVDCVARGTGGGGATAYCHGDDLSVHNHLLSLTLCAAALTSLAKLRGFHKLKAPLLEQSNSLKDRFSAFSQRRQLKLKPCCRRRLCKITENVDNLNRRIDSVAAL